MLQREQSKLKLTSSYTLCLKLFLISVAKVSQFMHTIGDSITLQFFSGPSHGMRVAML